MLEILYRIYTEHCFDGALFRVVCYKLEELK